ncbi:MAG: hypothetical protein JST42_17435 [Bacteroidetes bacterium]|nr:hypothetical protein [Bacteroidota bacterium]
MKSIIFLLPVFAALSVSAQEIKVDSHHRVSSLNCQTIDAAHGEELVRLSRAVKKEDFEEMCSVRKGKGRFELLSKDKKDGSKEFVCMIVGDEGNGIYLRLGLTETKKKPDDQ